jgi:hypothetical protein
MKPAPPVTRTLLFFGAADISRIRERERRNTNTQESKTRDDGEIGLGWAVWNRDTSLSHQLHKTHKTHKQTSLPF